MSQQTASPDLSIPSYAGAAHFAREAAEAHRIAAGRGIANAEDKAVGAAVMAKLLWHVEAGEGGFAGRTPEQVTAQAKRIGLDPKLVFSGAWAPGAWPVSKKEAA